MRTRYTRRIGNIVTRVSFQIIDITLTINRLNTESNVVASQVKVIANITLWMKYRMLRLIFVFTSLDKSQEVTTR